MDITYVFDFSINSFSFYWFTLELTAAALFSFRKSECVLASSQAYFFISMKLNRALQYFSDFKQKSDVFATPL